MHVALSVGSGYQRVIKLLGVIAPKVLDPSSDRLCGQGGLSDSVGSVLAATSLLDTGAFRWQATPGKLPYSAAICVTFYG